MLFLVLIVCAKLLVDVANLGVVIKELLLVVRIELAPRMLENAILELSTGSIAAISGLDDGCLRHQSTNFKNKVTNVCVQVFNLKKTDARKPQVNKGQKSIN